MYSSHIGEKMCVRAWVRPGDALARVRVRAGM